LFHVSVEELLLVCSLFTVFSAHAPIFRLRDFIFFLPQNFDFAANFVGKQSVIFGETGSGW